MVLSRGTGILHLCGCGNLAKPHRGDRPCPSSPASTDTKFLAWKAVMEIVAFGCRNEGWLNVLLI